MTACVPELLCHFSDLVSCDGDEVHGVINSFQDSQDGGESFLEVIAAIAAFTVLQQLL